MEHGYVIYDAAGTMVIGIFFTLKRAKEYVNGKEDEDFFIKKVPFNCIYHIDDRSDDIVWPAPPKSK